MNSEATMRPVLIVVTFSTHPTAPPNSTISGAVREAVSRRDIGFSRPVRRDSRGPTIPSPPPGGALLSRSRPSGALEGLTPCRVPGDLLALVGGMGPASLTVPRPGTDLLAVYDKARVERAAQIHEKGLRLHVLAPRPQLRADQALVERVLSTFLDVALGASPQGGRVHVVAREQEQEELVIAFAATWHSGSEGGGTHLGEDIATRPDLVASVEACRAELLAAGGDVFIDSDERSTTVRVSFPRPVGRAPLLLAA
jgi:hypothetical protein